MKIKFHEAFHLLQGDAALVKVGNRKRSLADRIQQLTENTGETGLGKGLRNLLLLLLRLPFVTAS